jgi:DNA-directed RNA polymerase beta subunit
LKFINPSYEVNKERNIFTLRKQEYETLEATIRQVLIPAEELGFAITDFGIRDPKFSTGGELNRTLKKNLVIKLQKESFEIDLSMLIPKLVDDNYIEIGGRKKIPLFQLFDIPFVTRGKNIKMRTNVASLMIMEEKEFPYTHISIFGKKVPLSLVMFAYYGYEQIGKMFDFSKVNITEEEVKNETVYNKLLYDLKDYYSSSEDYTKDDFIKEVGQYYSAYDYRIKGEDLIYGLDLILKADVMSARFFTTGTVLGDLLEVMKINSIDDTDFINKRVRCWEYAILAKVSKAVFDLCMSNRTSKQIKFNINSSQILSDCNVSNIIQFDFAINPIEELTMLSRTSLVGPGGFNRENVPYYLRDIQPSMFGRICPVDTPDRENCGILQSLLPNVKLDDNLKFSEETIAEQPISIPVTLVPFLKNDDQTRLQMASSQMRQSIMLLNFDQPMIKTGCEGLYTDFTQFIKRAKKDGEVIFADPDYIMIAYDDGDFDLINIRLRQVYVENIDMMEVYVTVGTKVKAGDIIAESNFCKNGEINIGRNLLTAIMPKEGYNYEDGIIISDRLIKENIFTSVHVKDLSFNIPESKILLSLEKDKYIPLPKPYNVQEEGSLKKKYSFIQHGRPYAILKEMPENPLEFNSVFKEELPLLAKHDLFVTDVSIYVNKYNQEIKQYVEWVEKTCESQIAEEKKLQDLVNQRLPKAKAKQFIRDNNLDKFSYVGKYKIKGEEINGIHVEMSAMYLRNIEEGDKIGNRHGNKGVISKILPHEEMPLMEDGRRVDICINPLGIISRMNVGQVFECNLAMSLNDLKNQMLSVFNTEIATANIEERDKAIKKYLYDYIKILDNTKDKWYSRQFKEQLKTIKITSDFINQISILAPPFESPTYEQVLNAMKYTETPAEYKIFDHASNDFLLNKVCVGYLYFFRMVHIAAHKIAFRSISMYNRKTLQPPSGRKNHGGQRCGEMEVNCLIGHDALDNLSEFLTTKSDCIDLKNQYIKSIIDSNYLKDDTVISKIPEAVNLLKNYLLVTGLDVDE